MKSRPRAEGWGWAYPGRFSCEETGARVGAEYNALGWEKRLRPGKLGAWG